MINDINTCIKFFHPRDRWRGNWDIYTVPTLIPHGIDAVPWWCNSLAWQCGHAKRENFK